jgi:5-methylcytosine-specific restriction enzyme subunit McrC
MECLRDPVVSKTITDNPDKLYKVYFNEPLIEIKDKEDEITPFFVVHFLHLVKKIVQKGLKKGYIKTTQNLTSKVKGKILINQTMRHNHLKNRLDKTMCNYQIFTINCMENQILKTALMKCSKYLFGIQDDTLSKILRQNISAFELVEQREVFNSDFLSIKHSPFYTEYKEALNLAQMIFKRFGFALNESPSSTQLNKIPPYYINMPELFERYVEVKLRQMDYDIIDGNKTNTAHWQMKPDFLLPSKKMIIDAKYKYWYESGKNEQDSENNEYKEDYMQLSLYGRDMKVRKSLGLQQDDDWEVDLIFIYPSFNASENLNLEQSQKSQKFNKISKIGLKIPFLYNIM